MENTIKTKNGIFTVNYVSKHYNFEMFGSDGYDIINILNVQYFSDFYTLKDKDKIENLFKELEPQIIQIMKFYVNENIEFYKHFDFDYTLISGYAGLTPTEIDNNNFFHISWEWFLKTELKGESLEYLKKLTHDKNLMCMDSHKF
jgi:hypothetical protein